MKPSYVHLSTKASYGRFQGPVLEHLTPYLLTTVRGDRNDPRIRELLRLCRF